MKTARLKRDDEVVALKSSCRMTRLVDPALSPPCLLIFNPPDNNTDACPSSSRAIRS
jgi:hypothetical protein